MKRIVYMYLFIALFAPVLANHNPLVCKQGSHWSFPAFTSSPYVMVYAEDGRAVRVFKADVDWFNSPADFLLLSPIPYDPSRSDDLNSPFVSPFGDQQFKNAQGEIISMPLRLRHWLGTTRSGADVLSGLIHGTRHSLIVGIFSILIATLVGFSLGAIAGFSGDHRIKINRGSLLLFLFFIIPAWFYSFHATGNYLKTEFNSSMANGLYIIIGRILKFIVILSIPVVAGRLIPKQGFLKKEFDLPVDTIISRFIELFVSIPRFVLIITLAALTKPSFASVVLVIGLTSWTTMARVVRAEFLRLRNIQFTEAAQSLGFPMRRILLRHFIPNLIDQVVVLCVFGIATAILTEAGLSFLGIGIPHNMISWGTLLFDGRQNIYAWWLVIFPGLALFGLVLGLNVVADGRRTEGSRL